MREEVYFAWSSGKDSAYALAELLHEARYELVGLLSTVTENNKLISTHGIGIEVLEQQAAAIALPLEKVYIPGALSQVQYERAMKKTLLAFEAQGVTAVAFGDLFLEDLKEYREKRMAEVGMRALFPLWKMDTKEVAYSFLQRGFQAVITCVDATVLDGSFAGRRFDEQLLADIPSSVDPSGENGEFHTFVYEGPIFRRPVRFQKGGHTVREGRYHFCEIISL
jgi:uncharacterized protein (TIGR00290 family)